MLLGLLWTHRNSIVAALWLPSAKLVVLHPRHAHAGPRVSSRRTTTTDASPLLCRVHLWRRIGLHPAMVLRWNCTRSRRVHSIGHALHLRHRIQSTLLLWLRLLLLLLSTHHRLVVAGRTHACHRCHLGHRMLLLLLMVSSSAHQQTPPTTVSACPHLIAVAHRMHGAILLLLLLLLVHHHHSVACRIIITVTIIIGAHS